METNKNLLIAAMNVKLKPCPFCGGQVKIDNIGDKKENIYPNRRKTPGFSHGECQGRFGSEDKLDKSYIEKGQDIQLF